MQVHYLSDELAVRRLDESERAAFEKWFAALEAEHAKLGAAYGDQPLLVATGVECWLPYFADGFSPADALAMDLAYAE